MDKGRHVYDIIAAILPFYVALLLGYGSIRWWKIFTPIQSSAINRFVTFFALPIYAFYFISPISPHDMNFKFIVADTLQKFVILVLLSIWNTFTKCNTGIDWVVTLFSLSTLPNTLVSATTMRSLYGSFTTSFVIQIAILQGVVWNNVLLFLYEYRAAKILFSQQIVNNTEGSTKSSKEDVESNVESLSDNIPLQRSTLGDSDSILLFPKSHSLSRVTNFDGVTLLETEKKRLRRSKSCSSVVINEECLVSINDPERKNNMSPPMSDRQIDDFTNMTSIPQQSGNGEENTQVIENIIENKEQMPLASDMTMLILRQAWRKLITNPNIYAVCLGIIWSLISYRWNIKMPLVISGPIELMARTGFGMIFFSLGVSMGSQAKIIPCRKTSATISLALKFLFGPAVMALTSFVVGIRGVLLQVSIVQAAFPEAIAPFVLAGQHNLYGEMHSTVVIFGLIVGLPISIIYHYVLLGL